MSDELKAENDALKAENAKLTGELSGLTEELKVTRGEARDRRHEGKTLAGQLEVLTRERDELKLKAEADPDGLRAQLADAGKRVSELRHERAYEKVAKGLRVTDAVKLADLVKVAGHTPDADADEPDEARIAATFGEALKGRPWLVDTPPAATATSGAASASATGAEAKPGPGADRGQSLGEKSSQALQRAAGRL